LPHPKPEKNPNAREARNQKHKKGRKERVQGDRNVSKKTRKQTKRVHPKAETKKGNDKGKAWGNGK